MKSNKSRNRKKESKPIAKEIETPKSNEEPAVKITPESVVVLTIYERGAIKHPDFSSSPDSRTEYYQVYTKTKLSTDAVQYFISDGGNPNPRRYWNGRWKSMGKNAKLKANIEHLANGNQFTYSVLN